jgi:hypothetical protein
MRVEEIRTKARDLGVTPGRLGKVDLIRLVQREEGNFDCFATAISGICDQTDCLWRDDCFAAAKKRHS